MQSKSKETVPSENTVDGLLGSADLISWDAFSPVITSPIKSKANPNRSISTHLQIASVFCRLEVLELRLKHEINTFGNLVLKRNRDIAYSLEYAMK